MVDAFISTHESKRTILQNLSIVNDVHSKVLNDNHDVFSWVKKDIKHSIDVVTDSYITTFMNFESIDISIESIILIADNLIQVTTIADYNESMDDETLNLMLKNIHNFINDYIHDSLIE